MTLRDAEVRLRAERDTASSFLVEASAGTGKTTTLIARIVKLVVDDGVPLRQIAAMTFTEKAAGEMKTRLREALDLILSGDKSEERKSAARRASLDLDAAEVSTIHAFCARLLRERPVEAGVDPDFTAGDELLAADLAEEAFRGWFDRAARRAGPVLDALRAGVSPEALRDLALALNRERLVLADATLPKDVLEEVRERIESLRKEWEAILALFPAESKGDKKAEQIRQALTELREWSSEDLSGLAGLSLETAFHLGHGSRAVLDAEARSRFKETAEAMKALASGFPALPFVPILTGLVEEIRSDFFLEIAEAKRRDGVLDFDDLLLTARNLLRSSLAAREHFHAKYRTLLVDEFQDTDPVQAEIVIRLAAAPDAQEGAWTHLVPEPGRLFLVGDPKQSIYRFRRADIETYGDAAARIPAGNRLLLTSNYRSAQPLLDFVNEVGPELLPPPAGRKYAVGYSPLEPSEKTEARKRPAVIFLSAPESEADDDVPGRSDDDADTDDAVRAEDLKVQEQEARAVANLLVSRFSGGEKPWSRIAILVPRHATIEFLEDAFRDAGIPFVLEGGKSFYRREEVAAAVEALKAIDDPFDGVAIVAALKSLLFGVSDRVLLDAVEAGVRFGDPKSVPDASPLFPAMQLLARLHRERHGRGVAATLSDLFASRQLFAAIENGAVVQPVQGLANLERLLAFARDLDRDGLSFRDAVARLVRRTREDAPEPGAFTEETDAVRLMTLHRAKGLEFDVVVLADLGVRETKPRGRKVSVVCERAGGRFGVRLGFGAGTVGTARLHEVEEEERARLDAEIRRLVYVSLTRAKEKLVISWFRQRRIKKNGDVSDGLGKSFLAPLAGIEFPPARLAPLVEVVKPDLSKPAAAPRETGPETAVDLPAALRDAEERLERVRRTSSRALRRAGEKDPPFLPLTPEDTEPADRDDAPDRARRIGVAVHEAMERLLGTPVPPDGASKDSALDGAFFELTDDERAEARPLAEALLSHPVTACAFASKRRFVEMPLLYVDEALPGRPLVEGKVDLLFEEADGWQIVDWKTDRLAGGATRAEREALYAPQLRAYEEGIRKVLGPGARVKPGLLVFARQPLGRSGPS